MFLARIDGTVVARQAHRSLKGFRLLIGQRLDAAGRDSGEPQILVDTLGAGRGDLVMVTSDGDLARRTMGDDTTPSRMMVLGIVDHAGGKR